MIDDLADAAQALRDVSAQLIPHEDDPHVRRWRTEMQRILLDMDIRMIALRLRGDVQPTFFKPVGVEQ